MISALFPSLFPNFLPKNIAPSDKAKVIIAIMPELSKAIQTLLPAISDSENPVDSASIDVAKACKSSAIKVSFLRAKKIFQ